MKKIYLTSVIVTLVMIILQSCSTKEYDENLKNAFQTMENIYTESNMVNLTMKKIVETSFQKSGEPQNMGKDILVILSDMAKEQYDNYEKDGVGKRISDNVNLLRSQTAALKNPPMSRTDCYNELMMIASEVCQLAEMTVQNLSMRYDNPVEFSSGNSSASLINQLISDFKLKYADVLSVNP